MFTDACTDILGNLEVIAINQVTPKSSSGHPPLTNHGQTVAPHQPPPTATKHRSPLIHHSPPTITQAYAGNGGDAIGGNVNIFGKPLPEGAAAATVRNRTNRFTYAIIVGATAVNQTESSRTGIQLPAYLLTDYCYCCASSPATYETVRFSVVAGGAAQCNG